MIPTHLSPVQNGERYIMPKIIKKRGETKCVLKRFRKR
jgi:hypothetical protein